MNYFLQTKPKKKKKHSPTAFSAGMVTTQAKNIADLQYTKDCSKVRVT